MGQEISTKERKSFVFYRGFAEAIAKCPIEEQLGIFKAIVAFALDGTEPELGSYGGIIWPLIQAQLIADWVRWNNGCHGGPPIGNRNNPNGRRGKGKRTNQELTENQPKTNQELTDPIYINDNDNVSTNVDIKKDTCMYPKKDELSLQTNIELRKKAFKEGIEPFVPKYGAEHCKTFFSYWTEHDRNGKMRFEKEKTWETPKRLRRWQINRFENGG